MNYPKLTCPYCDKLMEARRERCLTDVFRYWVCPEHGRFDLIHESYLKKFEK